MEDIINRIKEVRQALDLNQNDFAEVLNLKRNSITQIETGRRNPSDRTIMDICREFNVNEEWLKTGQGEMFREFTEDEKVATYVAELLEDDGDNAFNTLIIEIMRTYNELGDKEKGIIKDSCKKLIENINKKKEG